VRPIARKTRFGFAAALGVTKATLTPSPFTQDRNEPPTWELGDFTLRPLRLGDEIPWADYLSNPRVTQHTSIPNVDLETVGSSVQRHLAEYSTATSCRWALAIPDYGLIGTCGYSNWSLVHSHAELVYDLAPAYWRRGFMLRAVETVLGWAFTTAGFHRVHAFVMTTNEPSIALLKRCGFAREGTLRQFRIARGTRLLHLRSPAARLRQIGNLVPDFELCELLMTGFDRKVHMSNTSKSATEFFP
jgi:RimJ/RimL family protein N-acetyltransferase